MPAKFFFIILLAIFLSTAFFATTAPLYAQGLKNAGSELNKASVNAGVKDQPAPELLVGNIISAVLGFAGVVFLAITVYGGMLWLTARGNEEQVKKARVVIVRAIVGIFIVFLAYAITAFISFYVVGAPK